MLIATSASKLIVDLNSHRRQGARRCVSLVVTGGNLHAGHEALISAARSLSDIVVVAITPDPERGNSNVVSSDQFQDIALVDQASVDYLYTPLDEDVEHLQLPSAFRLRIPDGYPICTSKRDISVGLTMMLRFINTVQPDVVVCGERHYVEYRLLRQLVSDLAIRAQVQCIPTVREEDGLAMCANNCNLDSAERSQAPVLFQTLSNVAHAIRNGARNFTKLEKTAHVALKGAGFTIQSFGFYDDVTLAEPQDASQAFRIIGNAELGPHALYDNVGLSL